MQRLAVCLVVVLEMALLRDAAGQKSCDVDIDAQVIGRLTTNATGHWSATLQRTVPATEAALRDSALHMEATPRVWRCNGTTKQSMTITITGSLIPLDRDNKRTSAPKYVVHEEPEVWERAKSICENENAHLPILNSQKEAEEIVQLLKQFPNITTGIPIGITDKEKEGEWKTITGKPLPDWSNKNWPLNEPNGGIQENCVYAWYTTMGYYDWHCNDQKTPFVCEKIVG